MSDIIKHNPTLKILAQGLRRNMTKEECKLWHDFLKSHPLRFRRQVTVGHYILDFYCASAKIAIELDGSQHHTDEGKKFDAQRTEFLNQKGILVLRYDNWSIISNFSAVCRHIDKELHERIHCVIQ